MTLEQRIEALERALSARTAAEQPVSYYTSRYSGEEIDQRLSATGDTILVSDGNSQTISAALSNKADSSMGYLPGDSDIFAWAEQQQISCCFLVGTQVTNTPEPGFYVGELSIGAKGYEFRSIKLTQNTTGKTWVSVYMTITGEWVWTDWMPYATATPPQIYELTLSTDFSNVPDDVSRYVKNQFGEVTFQIRAKYVGDGQGNVHQIGTLPVGFRPGYYVEIPVVVNTGVLSLGIFAIDTLGGCYLHYYEKLPSGSIVSCGGTFLAQ